MARERLDSTFLARHPTTTSQYLVVDERPLLFHTGPRNLFGRLVREQIEKVLPLSQLRYIAFSHVEADECGSLPAFLVAAPEARPVCSDVAAMVSIRDTTSSRSAWPTARRSTSAATSSRGNRRRSLEQ